MAGMVGASRHLPSVTAVSVDTLFLVVMVCLVVEVSGFAVRSSMIRVSGRNVQNNGVQRYCCTSVSYSTLLCSGPDGYILLHCNSVFI